MNMALMKISAKKIKDIAVKYTAVSFFVFYIERLLMADLKKQYKTVRKLLGDGRNLQLSDANVLQYQDIFVSLGRTGIYSRLKSAWNKFISPTGRFRWL